MEQSQVQVSTLYNTLISLFEVIIITKTKNKILVKPKQPQAFEQNISSIRQDVG